MTPANAAAQFDRPSAANTAALSPKLARDIADADAGTLLALLRGLTEHASHHAPKSDHLQPCGGTGLRSRQVCIERYGPKLGAGVYEVERGLLLSGRGKRGAA